MKITYIGHSGFLAETCGCCYIFDYYTGALPPLDGQKAVIVFSSHAHQDHYNPEIFALLRRAGAKNITAVLSNDISPDAWPEEAITVIPVSSHKTYDLPCDTKVHTFQSTDEGVAFLLQCPEGTLYHAGDLNDWVWAEESDTYNREMTENYQREMERLNECRKKLLGEEPIDMACVPLDPRQEEFYARGMLGFLKEIPARAVYPMHFWDQPEIIDRFRADYPDYAHLIRQSDACS